MAHTRLADEVARLVALVAEADGSGSSDPRLSRRRFITAVGATGLAAAAAQTPFAPARRVEAAALPRVVVVGGGLAGLTAAYQLKQAGVIAPVYEANTRLGGRCWSSTGYFADGQVSEHGGELIDQGHTQVRQLAQALGLDLDNLLAAEVSGTEQFNFFDGAPYTYTQATDDIKAIWQKIHADVSAASYPTLYNLSTARGRALDQMSIIDWINESVPGGVSSRLGQLLDVAYTIEYGADSADQSSLNLLYLLGFVGQGQLRIFGPSNEKYHVRGGNDQITQRLGSQLAAQITTGTSLTAIARQATGEYVLTFSQGKAVKTITADRVVMAIPFSILRNLDLRKSGFSARKLQAIKTLGMGTNAKLAVQFTTRVWNALGRNGETYSDRGYQNTWETTRAQPGRSGILTNFVGGTVGTSYGAGTTNDRAKAFLAQVEPVLPGASAAWNGRALRDWWPGDPFTKGSYSYWRVGQYTTIAGAEREVDGGCHFAGEHTSIDFQGYLNGAVETGQRAAAEILALVK